MTVNITAFRDDELDADLAAVLGSDGVPDGYAGRPSADRRYISLGHLLSSRQASTTIGFSLVIVFAVSASIAFLHNPRKNIEIYQSNASLIKNITLKSPESHSVAPRELPKLLATSKIIVSTATETTPARRMTHSTAAWVKNEKPLNANNHLKSPDHYPARPDLSANTVMPNTSGIFIDNSRQSADLLKYSTLDVKHVPKPSVPVIANHNTLDLEGYLDTDTSATRARRDSVTALRSLRRQW